MLPTNVLFIERFPQDTRNRNGNEWKEYRFIPPKLAMRSHADKADQACYRLKKPYRDHLDVIRIQADSRGRNR
jgi:hypothetical protein